MLSDLSDADMAYGPVMRTSGGRAFNGVEGSASSTSTTRKKLLIPVYTKRFNLKFVY